MNIKVNTVCGASSSGVGLGSAGGAEVVPGVVGRAGSVGVRWCSGVCSNNSGGTCPMRLSRSGSWISGSSPPPSSSSQLLLAISSSIVYYSYFDTV